MKPLAKTLILLLMGSISTSWATVRYDQIQGSVSELTKKGVVLGGKERELESVMFRTNKIGKVQRFTSIARIYRTQYPWLLISTLEECGFPKHLDEFVCSSPIIVDSLYRQWDVATNYFEFPFVKQNLESAIAFCSAYDNPRDGTDIRETDSGGYLFRGLGDIQHSSRSAATNAMVLEMIDWVAPAWGVDMRMGNVTNIDEFYDSRHVRKCGIRMAGKFEHIQDIAKKRVIIPASTQWLQIFDGDFSSVSNRLDGTCRFRLILEDRYSVLEAMEKTYLFRVYEILGGDGYCFTVVDGENECAYKLLLKWTPHQKNCGIVCNKTENVAAERTWTNSRNHISALGRMKSGVLVMAERSAIWGFNNLDDAVTADTFNCISWTSPIATNLPSSFCASIVDEVAFNLNSASYHWIKHKFIHHEVFRVPMMMSAEARNVSEINVYRSPPLNLTDNEIDAMTRRFQMVFDSEVFGPFNFANSRPIFLVNSVLNTVNPELERKSGFILHLDGEVSPQCPELIYIPRILDVPMMTMSNILAYVEMKLGCKIEARHRHLRIKHEMVPSTPIHMPREPPVSLHGVWLYAEPVNRVEKVKKLDDIEAATIFSMVSELNDTIDIVLTFVHCEYYMRFGSGQVVGIITDGKDSVLGFDFGRDHKSLFDVDDGYLHRLKLIRAENEDDILAANRSKRRMFYRVLKEMLK